MDYQAGSPHETTLLLVGGEFQEVQLDMKTTCIGHQTSEDTWQWRSDLQQIKKWPNNAPIGLWTPKK